MPNPLIIRFLNDVQKLQLRFPVTEIAKATGFTKSNVSGFLSQRRLPSDAFLKKFYSVYYPESGITEDMYTYNPAASHVLEEPKPDYGKDDLIKALMATIDAQKITIDHLQDKIEDLETKQNRKSA